MPAAQAALLLELEDTLEHAPVERCAETLPRIADFFAAGAHRFEDAHIALFDRMIERLVDVAQPSALVALSRRLAPIRNAPPVIVRRLAAHPDIAIAAPLLARSLRLDANDLVKIAATESQAHKFAISGRTIVAAAVADALAEFGDRHVARNLAINLGAELSSAAMTRLAARAVDDRVLAEKLAVRPDVPPPVQQNLAEQFGAGFAADADPVINALRREVADAVEHAEAWRMVRALQRAGRLDAVQVRELAESGSTRAAAIALTEMCETPLDTMHRAMDRHRSDGAIDARPAHAIMQPPSGHRAAATVESTLKELDGLSQGAAEQIAAFLRAAA